MQKRVIPLVLSHKDFVVLSPPTADKLTTLAISVLSLVDSTVSECQVVVIAPTRQEAKLLRD
jgi:superfamily II DNA/RNA helicase